MKKIIIIFLFFLLNIVYSENLNYRSLNVIYKNQGFDTFYTHFYKQIDNYKEPNKKILIKFLIDITTNNKKYNSAFKLLKLYKKTYKPDFYYYSKMISIYSILSEFEKVKLYTDKSLPYINYMAQAFNLSNRLMSLGLYDKVLDVYKYTQKKLNKPAYFIGSIIRIYEIQEKYKKVIDEYIYYFVDLKKYNAYYFNRFRSTIYSHNLFSYITVKLSNKNYNKLPVYILKLLAESYYKINNIDKSLNIYKLYFSKNLKKYNNLYNIVEFYRKQDLKFSKLLFNDIMNIDKTFMNTDYYNKLYYKLNESLDYKFCYYIYNNFDKYKNISQYPEFLLESFYKLNDFKNFFILYKKYENRFKKNIKLQKIYIYSLFLTEKYNKIINSNPDKLKDDKSLYYLILSLFKQKKYKLAVLRVEEFILTYTQSPYISNVLIIKKSIKNNQITKKIIYKFIDLLILYENSKYNTIFSKEFCYNEFYNSILKLNNNDLQNYCFKLLLEYTIEFGKIDFLNSIINNKKIKVEEVYKPYKLIYEYLLYKKQKKSDKYKEIYNKLLLDYNNYYIMLSKHISNDHNNIKSYNN